MISLFTGIALLLAGGIVTFFFKDALKSRLHLAFACAASAFLLFSSLTVLLTGNEVSIAIPLSFPFGRIEFVMDGLSAFFVLLIGLGAGIVSCYSLEYVKSYRGSRSLSAYYLLVSILFAAMLLVVTARTTLAFLFLWEAMSLSSFFLVCFENEKKETVDAGLYYLAAMQVSFILILAGFLFLMAKSGSQDFSSFGGVLKTDGAEGLIPFILLFAGFGTKAGFVPFHTWLPKAHPAAPSPVSAVMSGIMIKTGLYGILRFILLSGTPSPFMGFSVLGLSVITGLMGIINAISQRDAKKMLAYSSVENIGIAGIGIGLGMLGQACGNPVIAYLGYFGGILHILNHFLFKTLLFFGIGSVYLSTHEKDMEKLGGLSKSMPATAGFFLAGTLALSGLPLFNGFIGEFAIYLGLTGAIPVSRFSLSAVYILCIGALALIGVLALFNFSKAYSMIFSGMPRGKDAHSSGERGLAALIPQGLLLVLMLVIGLFPQTVLVLLDGCIRGFVPLAGGQSLAGGLTTAFSFITPVLLVFAGLSAGLLLLRALLLRGGKTEEYKTWDCGYQKASPRLQYTSASFSGFLQSLFSPLTRFKARTACKKGGLPILNNVREASVRSQDIVESFAVNPLIIGLNKFLRFFLWVQSGNTQQYILYGILFLLGILIFIFGVQV